jgi:hypothetical protein
MICALCGERDNPSCPVCRARYGPPTLADDAEWSAEVMEELRLVRAFERRWRKQRHGKRTRSGPERPHPPL